MNHLSEEELIEQYYKEEVGRGERDRHLGECETCRAELARLEAALSRVDDLAIPERGEEYGTDVWNRIRAHLPEREKRNWFRWMTQTRRLATVGALAALLITAFFLGRISRPANPGEVVSNKPADTSGKEKKVLFVALGDHLDRSQMILVELSNSPTTGDVDISSEQQRAEELIASNRLYRQAADRSGDKDLVSVLDDLERVLLDVAHEPSQVNGEEMQAIRQRIESKGILFKVRVIGSKVRNDERRPEKQDAPISRSSSRQTT